MDSSAVNFIETLEDRVNILRASGNLNEALDVATAAVKTTYHALESNPGETDAFASSLEIRGDLHRDLGSLELARDDYRLAVNQLQDRPDRLAQTGRIYAILGAVYDNLGLNDRTVECWLKAIQFFERHNPPFLQDVVAIANNLGFLFKAMNKFDDAETQFLRALEIVHSQFGHEHEKTATISSNLGALYLAAGFHDQAREMHMMALVTREKLLGEGHPDTAQSQNNLALALIKTGDRSWARRYLEKSLAGFEALGSEYVDDLEAVASNYCDFLTEEGEPQLAELIKGRVREVIKKSTSAR